jgi:plastocyanin
MLERMLLRLALAALAALSLAGAAYGGGVAVEFDRAPTDAEAGVARTVGFTIRSAHEDASLQTGLTPLITATNAAADRQIEATAKPEGAPGHYAATLTFPAAGVWQWRIQPFGKRESYSLTLPGPLQVREKGATGAEKPQAPLLLVDAKGVDDLFMPRELTVSAGTTVRWSMTGKDPHTVTAVDGMFASGNLNAGQAYEFTFAEPGTYAYYCEYHGTKDGQGMFGKVIVTAAAVDQAGAAALPRTGGASPVLPAIVLVALLVVASGVALLWRGRSRAL